jgi:hypothetical protein
LKEAFLGRVPWIGENKYVHDVALPLILFLRLAGTLYTKEMPPHNIFNEHNIFGWLSTLAGIGQGDMGRLPSNFILV